MQLLLKSIQLTDRTGIFQSVKMKYTGIWPSCHIFPISGVKSILSCDNWLLAHWATNPLFRQHYEEVFFLRTQAGSQTHLLWRCLLPFHIQILQYRINEFKAATLCALPSASPSSIPSASGLLEGMLKSTVWIQNHDYKGWKETLKATFIL